MIVITGGSDGLGKALVRLYLDEGKRVISISRSSSLPGSEHLITDLLDPTSIQKSIERLNQDDEVLEVLINCAGVLSIDKLESLDATEIDRVLHTNLRAPMLLVSGLIEKIKRDGTDIVNVSSTGGLKGYTEHMSYGVSKWGLRGFSANLRAELRDYPSRVISFCPGSFTTRILEKAVGRKKVSDNSIEMRVEDVAHCLKQLVDLPKNMQVSEIIINRKLAGNER